MAPGMNGRVAYTPGREHVALYDQQRGPGCSQSFELDQGTRHMVQWHILLAERMQLSKCYLPGIDRTKAQGHDKQNAAFLPVYGGSIM